MKSFLIAVFLVLLICAFSIYDSVCLCTITDSLLRAAEELPKDIEAFEKEEALKSAEKLRMIWDNSVNRLTVTINHENINRADDAMNELYAAAFDNDAESFYPALMKFTDAVMRIRMFQTVSFDSIF